MDVLPNLCNGICRQKLKSSLESRRLYTLLEAPFQEDLEVAVVHLLGLHFITLCLPSLHDRVGVVQGQAGKVCPKRHGVHTILGKLRDAATKHLLHVIHRRTCLYWAGELMGQGFKVFQVRSEIADGLQYLDYP